MDRQLNFVRVVQIGLDMYINDNLTKNFKLKEFFVRAGYYDEDLYQSCPEGYFSSEYFYHLYARLQNLRDRLDLPINILSGYRSPGYNRSIGGAKNSFHMYLAAVDISFKNISTWLPLNFNFLKENFNGVIYYRSSSFVHLDMGWGESRPYYNLYG